MANPIRAPQGTASTNAVSTSLAVTTRSLRTPARCNNSPSVASVSEADGNSRGLTMPVRDRISQTANNATTMAKRAAFSPMVLAIMPASRLGWNRLELCRDDLGRRHQVLHAAEPCHVERQLQRLQRIGRAHVAAGFK